MNDWDSDPASIAALCLGLGSEVGQLADPFGTVLCTTPEWYVFCKEQPPGPNQLLTICGEGAFLNHPKARSAITEMVAPSSERLEKSYQPINLTAILDGPLDNIENIDALKKFAQSVEGQGCGEFKMLCLRDPVGNHCSMMGDHYFLELPHSREPSVDQHLGIRVSGPSFVADAVRAAFAWAFRELKKNRQSRVPEGLLSRG